MLLLSLRSLFSNERQKGSRSVWDGRKRGAGRSRGRKNHISPVKGKKSKKKRNNSNIITSTYYL